MTNLKKFALAGVAAMAFAAAPAAAQSYSPPSADGKATVRLYDAVTLDSVADVDFGTIVRDAGFTSGSVSLGTANNLTCGTAMTCTGAVSTGVFEIRGDDDSQMQVTVSGSDYDPMGGEGGVDPLTAGNGSLTLKDSVSGDTLEMAIKFSGMSQDRVVAPGSYTNLSTFVANGTGAKTEIRVYGDLALTDVANGVYVGNYTLTADYK